MANKLAIGALAAAAVAAAPALAQEAPSPSPGSHQALRVCVDAARENALEGCEELKKVLSNSAYQNAYLAQEVAIECVVLDGCLEADGPLIKDEVDVIFDVDSGQLYSLYEAFEDVDHTLEVVVEEHEGDALGEPTEFTGYYPVAVVTAAWCEANPDATFDMLQGMRSRSGSAAPACRASRRRPRTAPRIHCATIASARTRTFAPWATWSPTTITRALCAAWSRTRATSPSSASARRPSTSTPARKTPLIRHGTT